MSRRIRSLQVVLGLAVAASVVPLLAQRGGRNGTFIENVPYDGQFVYARIKYTPAFGGGGFGGQDPMWNHDYPRSDRIFPQILAELTSMHARHDASNVFTADDPELMKFPMVYLCEVGAWQPTEAEVLGFRRYLLKGGFALVDDFQGGAAWGNFVAQLERVLPGLYPVRLDASHPIYDSFYRIEALPSTGDGIGQRGGAPEFYGVFEDNDPTGRVLMIINYNFDVSEYWEIATTGRAPIVATNEAFRTRHQLRDLHPHPLTGVPRDADFTAA